MKIVILVLALLVSGCPSSGHNEQDSIRHSEQDSIKCELRKVQTGQACLICCEDVCVNVSMIGYIEKDGDQTYIKFSRYFYAYLDTDFASFLDKALTCDKDSRTTISKSNKNDVFKGAFKGIVEKPIE